MSAPPKPKLTLDYILSFGKYQGCSIAKVMLTDPDYIYWCLENISWFELDDRALATLPEKSDGFDDIIGHDDIY